MFDYSTTRLVGQFGSDFKFHSLHLKVFLESIALLVSDRAGCSQEMQPNDAFEASSEHCSTIAQLSRAFRRNMDGDCRSDSTGD